MRWVIDVHRGLLKDNICSQDSSQLCPCFLGKSMLHDCALLAFSRTSASERLDVRLEVLYLVCAADAVQV